ncbi:ADP-ribosylation factor-like protein 6-interacting protein 6 isoform X1 [Echeneis naucrates]|uniref:ADP-ribosylation factor-like protein 6-interacting protein 6 n=1 Tax=Echeneis naucrates TaxID=173247 RepID=A0A665ULQ8_ECHNA|nr:ADP-ribosylation factor-like protein 6-interacting protein 6 isoform X1 [Echeneis naucrates]
MSGQEVGGGAARSGPRRWSAVGVSVLGSAACVAAAGCVCALIYPILKELRAGRLRAEDGTEQRILGFWSVLVLSICVGSICFISSWTLSYLDSFQPGTEFPSLLDMSRDTSGRHFHFGYGVVVLNGIMGMITVIWTLT